MVSHSLLKYTEGGMGELLSCTSADMPAPPSTEDGDIGMQQHSIQRNCPIRVLLTLPILLTRLIEQLALPLKLELSIWKGLGQLQVITRCSRSKIQLISG